MKCLFRNKLLVLADLNINLRKRTIMCHLYKIPFFLTTKYIYIFLYSFFITSAKLEIMPKLNQCFRHLQNSLLSVMKCKDFKYG